MLLQPALPTRVTDDLSTRAPVVDIVVPVLNEESQIASSIRRLRSFLDNEFPFDAVVTIVDNGSTDTTLEIADRLAIEMHGVRVLSLEQKGRGRALRAAWSISDAAVVVYTDVDLSTSLEALLPLVAPLLSGHSDLAIGSRLARGARVRRGAKRELISRCYNVILRLALGTDSATPNADSKPYAQTSFGGFSHWSTTRAGSSTPSSWSSPSEAAFESTRFRWTGSTILTPGWTSRRPPRTTSAG